MPKELQFTTVGEGSVNLRWEQPVADDTNLPVSFYRVEQRKVYVPGPVRWEQCGTCNEPEMVVSGLVEGCSYKFRVTV